MIGLAVAAILMILLVVALAGVVSSTWTQTGTNILTSVGSDQELLINDGPVDLKAASESFFVLCNKETGEAIVGTEIQPPLGWDRGKYFAANKRNVDGKWSVIANEDSISLMIISEKTFSIKTKLSDSYARSMRFIFIVGCLLVFLAYMLVVRKYVRDRKKVIPQ